MLPLRTVATVSSMVTAAELLSATGSVSAQAVSSMSGPTVTRTRNASDPHGTMERISTCGSAKALALAGARVWISPPPKRFTRLP